MINSENIYLVLMPEHLMQDHTWMLDILERRKILIADFSLKQCKKSIQEILFNALNSVNVANRRTIHPHHVLLIDDDMARIEAALENGMFAVQYSPVKAYAHEKSYVAHPQEELENFLQTFKSQEKLLHHQGRIFPAAACEL